jgi:hypothetical protein
VFADGVDGNKVLGQTDDVEMWHDSPFSFDLSRLIRGVILSSNAILGGRR